MHIIAQNFAYEKSMFVQKGVFMQYLIVFLEGIITFISPCLLPMLSVYLSYFAGGEQKKEQTLIGAIGFVTGFTIMFLIMGALAGTVGNALNSHQKIVNIVTGIIVIIFGLSFMGVLKISLLQRTMKINFNPSGHGFLPSMIFGFVFSIGWTPCVGAFLGSALLLASQHGSAFKGILMLLCYSLGLGIPFIISAVVIDSLKGAFTWIKSHYKQINTICGLFLVIVGIFMSTGYFGKLLSFLSVI